MKYLLYICIALCLVGCTKTVYVPIESVRVEYQDRYLRDSIYRYDSVYFAVKGDTVWLEKYKILYKDRFFRDSIFIQDTIQVPYPVEKSLSRWEKTKMDTGGWAIGVLSGVCLLGIGYVVYWLIGKKK